MSDRLFRMMERHARIDAALQIEQRRRGADWRKVSELKKLKLRIKDLIHRLLTRQRTAKAR